MLYHIKMLCYVLLCYVMLCQDDGIKLVKRTKALLGSIHRLQQQARAASLPQQTRVTAGLSELTSLKAQLRRHQQELQNSVLHMYDLQFLFADMLALLDRYSVDGGGGGGVVSASKILG
jgi:hypothetical protein